jgi:spore coat polysaccharide biosynthesis protein SpsF
MRKVLIVQARMGSTRLPGKVLMEVAGRPLLAQQLRRLRRCREVDEIVVATSTTPADDAIVELCRREGVGWFRGSEEDVLSRYRAAAAEFHAGLVIRVTSDCPLIDPEVTDRVIRALESSQADYATNVIPRTYPRGLDTEAVFFDVLVRCDRMARSPHAREHVTHFIVRERPDLFIRQSVTADRDDSDLRWTVDEAVDLELVRELYTALGLSEGATTGYMQIAEFQRGDPRLLRLNASVTQKPA